MRREVGRKTGGVGVRSPLTLSGREAPAQRGLRERPPCRAGRGGAMPGGAGVSASADPCRHRGAGSARLVPASVQSGSAEPARLLGRAAVKPLLASPRGTAAREEHVVSAAE